MQRRKTIKGFAIAQRIGREIEILGVGIDQSSAWTDASYRYRWIGRTTDFIREHGARLRLVPARLTVMFDQADLTLADEREAACRAQEAQEAD